MILELSIGLLMWGWDGWCFCVMTETIQKHETAYSYYVYHCCIVFSFFNEVRKVKKDLFEGTGTVQRKLTGVENRPK